MPTEARRHTVPGRPLLRRRGAGRPCSLPARPRRLYNEWRSAAGVGGKMKSLLNAFAKKEGKGEPRGARCMGLGRFPRVRGGRGPPLPPGSPAGRSPRRRKGSWPRWRRGSVGLALECQPSGPRVSCLSLGRCRIAFQSLPPGDGARGRVGSSVLGRIKEVLTVVCPLPRGRRALARDGAGGGHSAGRGGQAASVGTASRQSPAAPGFGGRGGGCRVADSQSTHAFCHTLCDFYCGKKECINWSM